MKTIAITGATGFVGKRMIAYNRKKYRQNILSLRDIKIAVIDLTDVDAVIHLAGKAHDMSQVDDSIYFKINYDLTKQLADRAKEQGVSQFVYISSTKVYGDDVHEILNESSPCIPTDAYGASKLKAEQYLQSIQSDLFKVAIVRPPLVYGPEVKGNMVRLLKLSNKNMPLPLGKINNARSIVFVDNLIELINTIIEKKASGVFVAGDKTPLSTNELISLMRKTMGKKNGLISIPAGIRSLIKKLRPALYTRLFGSFVVNNTSTNTILNFQPPYTTEEGIAIMVNWFKNNQSVSEFSDTSIN
jgi:nucleoside-diphosphate-sugar epimerase